MCTSNRNVRQHVVRQRAREGIPLNSLSHALVHRYSAGARTKKKHGLVLTHVELDNGVRDGINRSTGRRECVGELVTNRDAF